MNTTVVILAAGLGTRMRSKHAKVLHRAGGLALVEHVVTAARAVASPDHIVVVTGHQADQVESLLAPIGLRFARQREPKGTGHALASCRGVVPGEDGLLMVLYGDTPLLSARTLTRLRDVQAASGAAATLITTRLPDPTGYGRVLLDETDGVSAIVEEKSCTPEQRSLDLVNSGIYCFRSDLLWRHIGEIEPDIHSREYYLTDMAGILSRHGYRVQPMHVEDSSELVGINTRVELADADRLLRRRKAEELMLAGVTIERPETVTIDARVEIGADTVIEPFTRLLGATEIGEDCRVGAGSILESAILADGAIVKPYSLVSDSRIGSGAHVGPFSRLRMNARIGERARVGNFVEVKNSRLGERAKSQHLAYLGDSDIGDAVNIGAGTITCNFDGERKHETKIGAGAFVGSNATLVAPIEIGEESYIGAGSVITDPVPARTLALGRGRQVIKEDWLSRRKNSAKNPEQA
ncbi:MAG TPA: bifunctional UDP-N-acetylglucosamine diphosphorylase/glucosamine-1-phosphate N-acetyltransferase GlmU [Bryobacteraceae bacterium]|nr:bifunctional UDP-N-acetylglucosamine diphosphorylase/glucosamine-1-phosphate N-acetyltransferase GlmU [Bryobacteraceae bacterium]